MHHFRYARLAPWSTRNRREHEHGQNNTLYVLFLSFGIPVSAPRDGQAPTEDVQPDLKAKRAALDSRKLSCNRTDPGPLKKNGF